jgi:beta-glucosidase
MRPGATVFPQAIALAATWDTMLMEEVAAAIAAETRSRGIRQVLSPVVNLSRDGRWGRTEESYGEDPLLASAMGRAFIRPFETAGVVTTPKHLVANVGDGGRDSWPIEASERELREVWFPPFRAAIDVGARSLMTAYNAVNGVPASQNRYLLTEVLRERWGFRGFVISDAAATAGATVLHMTESSIATSARHALEAGLDVIFQSSWEQHRPWLRAFLDGSVPDSLVDRAVTRVLRAKFELGLFERPYVEADQALAGVDWPAHDALAREAAIGGMVLLRNGGLLPFAPAPNRVALIGEDAVTPRFGGYSGRGRRVTTILDALRASPSAVAFAPGPGRTSQRWSVVPPGAFDAGVAVEVWGAPRLDGAPHTRRREANIDFASTFNPPARGLRTDWYAIRWTGELVVDDRARRLAVIGDDGYRLWVDDSLVIDAREQVSFGTRAMEQDLPAGTRHAIRLEYREGAGNGRVTLVWSDDDHDQDDHRIVEAVELARGNDVAIVVAGIEEGEFRDRASLAVPGRQEELIRRVAATGTPTVVVLVGGGPVTMPWLSAVDAVLMAWYPGEAGGAALRDVLFGAADPGGRLPITFPLAEGQLPLTYDHRPTGRGNDYLDLSGRPLFPFGYGMSYTSFAYDSLVIDPDDAAGDRVRVGFTIRNTGSKAGTEVAQLYLRDELASVIRPVRWLARFAKLRLDPGESRRVEFRLGPDDFALLDTSLDRVIEPGTFRVMVARSSRDIRLAGTIEISGRRARLAP